MINDGSHTALHEAGHAVIGRVLGMLCGHATIIPDRDSGGHAITEDPWIILGAWETAGKLRARASVLRGRIMTFQAGAEAEAEILGACRQGADEDDRYQVALMAEDLGRDDGGEGLRRHTRRLVRRHRAAIERVAAALVDKQRLTAKQIDDLVWSAAAMTDFVTFAELRPRFRISATREALNLAMRLGSFPRGHLFNRRIAWRVREIEPLAGLRVRIGRPGSGV